MAKPLTSMTRDELLKKAKELNERVHDQEASMLGLLQSNKSLTNELSDEMQSMRNDFIAARGALMRIDRLLELKPELKLRQVRQTLLPLINEGMQDGGWKYDEFGNKEHW